MSDCFDHFADAWESRERGMSDYDYKSDDNNNYRTRQKDINGAEDIVKIIFKRLTVLEPYKYHTSLNGSIYVKFHNAKIGSLRISDHKERKKYGYRWNLRFDLTEKQTKNDRGYGQFYYPILLTERLCGHMINFDKKVKENNQC